MHTRPALTPRPWVAFCAVGTGQNITSPGVFPAAVQGVPVTALLYAGHTLNNPIRYSDPSGHIPATYENGSWHIDEALIMENLIAHNKKSAITRKLQGYGVYTNHLNDNSDNRKLFAIGRGVVQIGEKLYSEQVVTSSSAQEAFATEFQTDTVPIHIIGTNNGPGYSYYGGSDGDITSGGYTVGLVTKEPEDYSVRLIKLVTTYAANQPISGMNNVIHELFHIYGNSIHGGTPDDSMPDNFVGRRNEILLPVDDVNRIRWQMNTEKTRSETFADFGVAWVNGAWLDSDTGIDAQQWMNETMWSLSNLNQ